MPVVHICTWPMSDEDKLRTMIEEVTRVVHQSSGAPLDKISVYVTEIAPSRWADGGVLGSDPSFPEKSRRQSYGDSR